MIKKIRLVNFFSFKDTEIEFNPYQNILIGVNGAGKSNLLKALKLLNSITSGQGLNRLIIDRWGGFDSIFFHQKTEDYFIKLQFIFNHNVLSQYGYKFENDLNYNLEVRKTPNDYNYYLNEKIFHFDKNNQELTLLEFNNGKGKVFEKYDDNGQPFFIEYSGFDDRESYFGRISDPQRYPALNSLKEALKSLNVYDYFDFSPDSRIRKPISPSSESVLRPDGQNLTQLLNSTKINDKSAYKEIKKLMNYVNSNFDDLDFNFYGGTIELRLEEQFLNKSVHVTHISDGTLKFLCLLAIFCNKNRGKVVCIDEPENGLHPDMIHTIAQCIRDTSHETQYIISTHSAYLLDLFELENILVFEKDENNSTIVKKLSAKNFKGWYKTFLPGKMWRQGDLGGNRW